MAERTPRWIIALALILCFSSRIAWPQAAASKAASLGQEPHHHLVLENSSLRVFRLVLKQREATVPHLHPRFYTFVVLHGGEMSNEVKGRPAVPSSLSDGEVRTSGGGFTLVEHNTGQGSLELLVVEPTTQAVTNAHAFEEPAASFKYHDAVVGPLFESPPLRGYEMTIASGGRTETFFDRYDHLLIALTDVQLKDEAEGRGELQVRVNASDVSWFPGGVTHKFTNTGSQPAHFIVIESD